MIIDEKNCLLLIIDIQEKLINSTFNKDLLENKARIIANAAKILSIPIIVTEQYPKGLGETISGLKENAKTFIKTDFNALSDEELLNSLVKSEKKQILIIGIETHICVYQTVEALLKNGFEVFVLSDACGSRSENEYKSALDYMNKINANIKTVEMAIFDLLKTAKHPHFKEIQALIK